MNVIQMLPTDFISISSWIYLLAQRSSYYFAFTYGKHSSNSFEHAICIIIYSKYTSYESMPSIFQMKTKWFLYRAYTTYAISSDNRWLGTPVEPYDNDNGMTITDCRLLFRSLSSLFLVLNISHLWETKIREHLRHGRYGLDRQTNFFRLLSFCYTSTSWFFLLLRATYDLFGAGSLFSEAYDSVHSNGFMKWMAGIFGHRQLHVSARRPQQIPVPKIYIFSTRLIW